MTRNSGIELMTNPPPGSKLAAAKEWGVDLTLLYESLERTPTKCAQTFGAIVRSFEAQLRGPARINAKAWPRALAQEVFQLDAGVGFRVAVFDDHRALQA